MSLDAGRADRAARSDPGVDGGAEILTHRKPATPRRVGSREIEIYSTVHEAILQHSLPPGTKLNEMLLGEVFGVSRTKVRPVLARLAHEGMVDLEPNRGAFVARPSKKATRDLFDVRRILECNVIARLASALDDASIAMLRRTVADEARALQIRDVKMQLHLSGLFHLQLAEFSGNKVYGEIVKELISRTSLAIALYQAPGTSGCRCDDHAHLLAHLESRDADAAARLMSEHLANLEGGLQLDVGEPVAVDLRDILSHLRSGHKQSK